MASAGRKLRAITPLVAIMARPEVVNDNSIMINCSSVVVRLKEKMQLMVAEDAENMEQPSNTDKERNSQDDVCVVLEEVAATSDSSDSSENLFYYSWQPGEIWKNWPIIICTVLENA